MANFYALRLGNGNWFDTGGAQDPVNKVVTDLQNARIYNSIRSAKMQQTEFIKNRKRFPNNKAFQQKCEIIKLQVSNLEVAVTDQIKAPSQDSVPKKYDPRQKQKPKVKTRPKKQTNKDRKPGLVDLMKRNR